MKNLSGREGDHNFKAYLGTDRYRALVNTDLVMSNSPIGQKIYFAVGTPLVYEHRNMKEKLTTIGERFEERTKTIQERTVGLIRRRRIEDLRVLYFMVWVFVALRLLCRQGRAPWLEGLATNSS